MVKMKKGFLKKTGCILISTSIILTGFTFFGSSVSEADLDGDIQNEELIENTQENSEIGSVVDGTTNSTTTDSTATEAEVALGKPHKDSRMLGQKPLQRLLPEQQQRLL